MNNTLKIILPIVTLSENKFRRMHWTKERKIKKDYMWQLMAVGANDEKFKVQPGEKRRMKIISYRKSLLDYNNFLGGLKNLIDAIKDVGLIFDDCPAYLVEEVHEQILDPKNQRTEIIISSL